MENRMIRALCVSGGIRILACDASVLTREAVALQGTSATASIALARGLAGGALMGGLLKEGQRIALKFEGNGPLRKLLIEADSGGAVCGSVGDPLAETPPRNGKWNVAELIGKAGFLTVAKDLGLGGKPYRGMVQLVSSEIGDDLAYYLTESEQIPSAVGLGAALDLNGQVSKSGGFLVQALPKVREDELEKVMARLSEIPPIPQILEHDGPEGLIGEIFGDIPYTALEARDIFFRCGCSREKVEQALLTLGPEELSEMRDSGEAATITCEFCRKTYQLNAADLSRLMAAQAEAAGS